MGPKTILSNVVIDDDLDIPAGFLYHTVPMTRGGHKIHVTVAFHVTDDMKFSADVATSENLQFGGKLLEKLFSICPETYSKTTVFSQNSPASLWNAKLFTGHQSMSESFRQTVKIISALQSQVICCCNLSL